MLKQTIRPEFLNRIDETIMFLPLRKDEIADVVRLQINAVKRMLEPQGFELKLVDRDAIAAANFTVAVDAVNSVGGVVIPQLLEALGVKNVIKLYCEPTVVTLPMRSVFFSRAVRSGSRAHGRNLTDTVLPTTSSFLMA